MPLAVRRTNAAATVSSGGNSRGGNKPLWAATSHRAPTTRKGKAVRATTRHRSSQSDLREGAAASVTSAGIFMMVLTVRMCQRLRKDNARLHDRTSVAEMTDEPNVQLATRSIDVR